jgi:tRNA (mo5U34)-methyltransferase
MGAPLKTGRTESAASSASRVPDRGARRRGLGVDGRMGGSRLTVRPDGRSPYPLGLESRKSLTEAIDTRKREVGQIRWWHTLDLGNGIVTPGISNNVATLRKIGLPARLEGKTVLDIGAWDGYFSFEAERRGASRVLATDSFAWSGEGWGTKAGFELARRVLGSRVEDLRIDVMDLSPDRIGQFDLVLFLGVLYHLRHPLLALERVFSVTRDQLILETHSDLLWTRRPAIAFYPDAQLDGDPTSWCGPNPPAIAAMLRAAGFRRVKEVSRYSRLRTVIGGAMAHLRTDKPTIVSLQRCRVVLHAWR